MERRAGNSVGADGNSTSLTSFSHVEKMDQRAQFLSLRHSLFQLLGSQISELNNEKDFLEKARSRKFQLGFYLEIPTREWLRGAMDDGAISRMLNESALSERQKRQGIVFVRYVFTSERFDSIGKSLGYTEGTVPQRLYREFIQRIHESSSDAFKDKIKFQDLNFLKVGVKNNAPRRGAEFGRRMSEIKGGVYIKIENALSLRHNTVSQIVEHTGLSREQVRKAIWKMRQQGRIGKNVGVLEQTKRRNFIRDLRNGKSLDHMKDIPESFSNKVVRYNKNSLPSLTNVLQSAGLSVPTSDYPTVLRILASKGFTVFNARSSAEGGISYHLSSEQVDYATIILSRNPELRFYKKLRYPGQIAGPSFEGFYSKDRSRGISAILRQKDLSRTVLDLSPVAVFSHPGKGLRVMNEQMGAFMRWVDEQVALQARLKPHRVAQEQVVFSAS